MIHTKHTINGVKSAQPSNNQIFWTNINDVRFSAFSFSIKFTTTLPMTAPSLQLIKITVSKHVYRKLHCLIYTTLQVMSLWKRYIYTYHVNGKQQGMNVHKHDSEFLLACGSRTVVCLRTFHNCSCTSLQHDYLPRNDT